MGRFQGAAGLRADHLRLAMNHIMERDTDSIDIGMLYYPRLLSAMNILYRPKSQNGYFTYSLFVQAS
jgi:hypothetical protein